MANDEMSIADLNALLESEEDPESRKAIEDEIHRRAEEMVNQWGDYAKAFCKPYYKRFPGAEPDDVLQQALLGLWEAAKKFDDSRGGFHTISLYYMRKYINKLYPISGKIVSRKNNPKYSPKIVDRMIETMRSEGRGDADFDSACDRLGIPLAYRQTLRDAWNLDHASFATINNRIHSASDDDDSPIDDVVQSEKWKHFRDSLDFMPPVVKEILLDYSNNVRQEDTCKRLGISRPSLYHYRQLGIEWMRYYMKVGPKPKSPLDVRAGLRTAVRKDEWEDVQWSEEIA